MFLTLIAVIMIADPAAKVVPLKNAHAHNDYNHPRPLDDALDHGFCSVEADILLVNGELLVGHGPTEVKPGRTLEKLYLEPLRRRAKANGGKVYPEGTDFYLHIDVKTDGEETYKVLAPLLERYADILSVTRDRKFERKAVTAVISGNSPRKSLTDQNVRYAGFDGRLSDLSSDAPTHLIPVVSANWAFNFRWAGKGEFPAAEKEKLATLVKQLHDRGRLVRFWATPELPAVWDELLAAGVDFINTDELDKLRDYLVNRKP
jgi:hypothetical protein